MQPVIRSLLLAFAFLCGTGSLVFAQSTASHWGILFSVTPEWEIPKEAKELFIGEPHDLRGREFRIGFVRGRSLSGDWGLSVVRRAFKDGATFSSLREACFGSFGCGPEGVQQELHDGILTGIELHKYMPFGTIKKRAQIGLQVSVGVARLEGTVQEFRYSPFVTNSTGHIIGVSSTQPPQLLDEYPAEDAFIIKPVPTGGIELAVAGIVTPYLKLRVSGGLSFPGYHRVAVSLVYLPMSR